MPARADLWSSPGWWCHHRFSFFLRQKLESDTQSDRLERVTRGICGGYMAKNNFILEKYWIFLFFLFYFFSFIFIFKNFGCLLLRQIFRWNAWTKVLEVSYILSLLNYSVHRARQLVCLFYVRYESTESRMIVSCWLIRYLVVGMLCRPCILLTNIRYASLQIST